MVPITGMQWALEAAGILGLGQPRLAPAFGSGIDTFWVSQWQGADNYSRLEGKDQGH